MSTTPVVLYLLLISSAWAQSFTNLDFEAAQVQLHDPAFGFLDWAIAVPGWQHSSGRDTQIVYYKQTHFGDSQSYLLMDAFSPEQSPGTQLAGKYSVQLANGNAYYPPNIGWTHAYLAQTGRVPADTLSLRLLARGPLAVFLDGTRIPMKYLGRNAYAGDIAAFAGRTVELRLENITPNFLDRPPGSPPPTPDVSGPLTVDNIVFSPLPIPEAPLIVSVPTGRSMIGNPFRTNVLVRELFQIPLRDVYRWEGVMITTFNAERQE